MPVIKRYPNRKLYNTSTKEYITLEKIAEIIRAGEEIHVVDHATGEDLTAMTLTQVLFEQAKQRSGILPRTVLTGLIQAGGSRLAAIQRTLASSLGLWQHADNEIRRRIGVLVRQGELGQEEGQRLEEQLLSLGDQGIRPGADQAFIERILEERGVATRGELGALLEQLDALSARLDEYQKQAQPEQEENPD
jgi:polyhydroxyalkanoate synthesis repressor PhaR